MGQKGSGLKNIKYLRQFSHISSRITLSLTQICLNPVRLTKNDRKKEKKIIKKNIFQGLSSENGVRYSRCKAKNATFYYKMLHFFYFELTIIVLWILDILRVKVCHIVRAG